MLEFSRNNTSRRNEGGRSTVEYGPLVAVVFVSAGSSNWFKGTCNRVALVSKVTEHRAPTTGGW
jgi:hypothetical protein